MSSSMNPPGRSLRMLSNACPHVFPMIGSAVVDGRRDRLVEATDRSHQRRLLRVHALRVHPPERTVLVDHMDQGPGQAEHRNIAAHQLELSESPEAGLAHRLVAQVAQAGGGLADPLHAPARHPEHQRLTALIGRHDGALAEHQPRLRPGETGEEGAGHQGGQEHAHEDFRRGHHVPVDGGRRHETIAHGGQRLDAEEEGRSEGAGRGVVHRSGRQPVEGREEQVDREIAPQDQAQEPRPTQRQNEVVGVVDRKAAHADLHGLQASEIDAGRRELHRA
jgi:hypothetical protein